MKDPAKIKHEIKQEQHTSHEILSSIHASRATFKRKQGSQYSDGH
jgi:hypothetical protein